MGERLKTQDKLKAWEIRDGNSMVCAFCKVGLDSHVHLFFSCPFSMSVWKMMQPMMIMDLNVFDWHVVVDRILPVAARKLARVMVSKLCLAATIYGLLWERNSRIFKKVFRTEKQVFDAIVSNVRLKLMTISFKNSSNVSRIRDIWRLDNVNV
ncbi:uncharacterized protein [Rutidosis leptorrhynchoides]|uniref:uncharacterized protein n=1 Tax=Rutidosis leptorrhynchoides TaxID=125765 RepID=UPI003A99EE58